MTEIGGRPLGQYHILLNACLTARSFMMIVTAKVWIILALDLHGHAMHPVTKGVYKHIIDFCQQASAAIPYPHSALTGFPRQGFAKLIEKQVVSSMSNAQQRRYLVQHRNRHRYHQCGVELELQHWGSH